MRIGIIWVGYQCGDLLSRSLTPWVEARRARLGGNDFVIAAVSVPFAGFDNTGPRDGTERMLLEAKARGEIDTVITLDNPIKETEARWLAAIRLLTDDVTFLWLVDADEFYTLAEIESIFHFVEANPYTAWFRGSLKQVVFTHEQYLVDPFNPPRGFRVCLYPHSDLTWGADTDVPRISFGGFSDDNDGFYRGWPDERVYRLPGLPSMTVPTSVGFTRHETWLNDERSRRKCEYQTNRGWDCSYRWDDKVGLCFNEDHFTRRGLPLPEVRRDE